MNAQQEKDELAQASTVSDKFNVLWHKTLAHKFRGKIHFNIKGVEVNHLESYNVVTGDIILANHALEATRWKMRTLYHTNIKNFTYNGRQRNYSGDIFSYYFLSNIEPKHIKEEPNPNYKAPSSKSRKRYYGDGAYI